MYIKEIEVDNFKSFANGITIPFLKGFTTIAGPNGSGKSTIIDAILFALGLTSARNLRSEQLSDFISNHTKRNEAYVKVVFEPEGEQEENLSVARKIRKSSQGYNSVYYLNDKVSTLIDIHSKLADYRITPNSYNVIMQSDVMSITTCSNTERRKIIDEIAGVADFDRRIDKAKADLQTVEERVEKANLVLSEIDSTIEQLAAEKEVALKYQKLKLEKQQAESQITTVKFFDLKRNLELAHQNILESNKKKKEEEAKLKKVEDELAEINKKYSEISEAVKNNGEAEQIETKKKLEEQKGIIERKKMAVAAAEKTIHDNSKTIENAKSGIENHDKKIGELKAAIEAKKAEIKEIEKNIELQQKELSRILEEVSGLNENADKQLQERNDLKKELEKLKEDEWGIKEEALPLESELKIAKDSVEGAKKALDDANKFKAEFGNNKDKLELQIEELTKELNDFKLAQESILLKIDKNKNEDDDLMHDMQVLQKKVLTMEAQKSALEEVNLGRAVDSIMNAKIPGVHAPLMQLATVEKKYATALEVATGGRMKNIVVDDVDTANKCREYLKISRAGVVTCLPLDKMKKAPSNLKLPKEKGVIDFAINLMDFDDIYLDAFFYALGDTLVVEDFECARQFIGKYRTVALDGSLFEKAGAITVGERKETGLKFGQNQDAELQKLKDGFTAMQKNYAQVRAEAKELEERRDKIRSNYSETMTALNSAKIEYNNLKKDFENTEQKIEENKKILAEAEPKIKSIEAKLEKYELKQVELNDKMLVLQDKITEIESKMSEGELKKLKEMTSAIEGKIKEYQNAVLRCNNEISEMGRTIDFNNDLKDDKNEQIKRLLRDNETAENDKVNLAEEIKVVEVKVKELDEKIALLGEKLKELQGERDKVHEELIEADKRKNAINLEIEKLGEQVESFKARRKELEPALEEAEKELDEAGIDIKTLTPTEISIEEITSKIQRLQKRMEDMEPVNMRAIQTYDEVKARQEEKREQINTLTNERKQILEKMSGYEQIKKETFMTTYDHINENFKEVFASLADGQGNLVLENPENPFDGGLTIEAQPRDKKKQKLVSMSGGEKSLTALALVFAIQKYLPAPFYALDEVDASLDGINLNHLIDTIVNQSKNTQFIVVSHKQAMIKLSDRTIGVTQKEHGRTKVTGVTN